jgi:Holliday junction resolvase
MSYARGRRFEHLVKDKIRDAGFVVRRVALSGRQQPGGAINDIPNTDIIVEEKFFGKAKTTKAKKYVSFPESEIMELHKGDQDFLVFNFKRTPPFVVVRFNDFLRLLKFWKEDRSGSD